MNYGLHDRMSDSTIASFVSVIRCFGHPSNLFRASSLSDSGYGLSRARRTRISTFEFALIRSASSPPESSRPARHAGRNARQHRDRENPQRRQREGSPRKRELDRPAKERAIDHAGEHHRKTKARHHPDHRGQRSDHRGFPKQKCDVPAPRSRLWPAHIASSRERSVIRIVSDRKIPGDRNDHRDRSQHVGHRKGLVENFEDTRSQ